MNINIKTEDLLDKTFQHFEGDEYVNRKKKTILSRINNSVENMIHPVYSFYHNYLNERNLISTIKSLKTNEERFNYLLSNVDDPGEYYQKRGLINYDNTIVLKMIKHSSGDLSNDYDFMLNVLLHTKNSNDIKLLGDKLKFNKNLIIELLKQKSEYHWRDWIWLEKYDEKLFEDSTFVVEVLKTHPLELFSMPAKIRDDEDMVYLAVESSSKYSDAGFELNVFQSSSKRIQEEFGDRKDFIAAVIKKRALIALKKDLEESLINKPVDKGTVHKI